LELIEGQRLQLTPTGDVANVPFGLNREESFVVPGKIEKGGKLVHKCWEPIRGHLTGKIRGGNEKIVEKKINKGEFIQINEYTIAEGTD